MLPIRRALNNIDRVSSRQDLHWEEQFGCGHLGTVNLIKCINPLLPQIRLHYLLGLNELQWNQFYTTQNLQVEARDRSSYVKS